MSKKLPESVFFGKVSIVPKVGSLAQRNDIVVSSITHCNSRLLLILHRNCLLALGLLTLGLCVVLSSILLHKPQSPFFFLHMRKKEMLSQFLPNWCSHSFDLSCHCRSWWCCNNTISNLMLKFWNNLGLEIHEKLLQQIKTELTPHKFVAVQCFSLTEFAISLPFFWYSFWCLGCCCRWEDPFLDKQAPMTQTAFSNNPADGFSSSSSSWQRSRFYSSSSAIGITYVQTEQQQTESSIVSCKSQPGGSFGSRCTKESQGIVKNGRIHSKLRNGQRL